MAGPTKRPKTKGPPIAFQWHRALRRWPHPWASPGKTVVVAVASVFADYAGSDGSNAHPSIRTIVSESGATERSVLLALPQLVDLDWLVVTAKAIPFHHPTIYRLTIPTGAREHPYDEPPMPAQEQAYDEPAMPARMPARMPAHRRNEVLPPLVREEEEECASAPVADAPGAAHRPKPTPEPVDPTLKAVCGEIGRHARVSIDAATLAPALDATMARLGWGADEAAVYCVEKLRRMGNKVHRPAAFLAADLAQLNGDLIASPRMVLARLLGQIDDLDEQAEATARDDDYDSPLGRFEERLVKAELMDEGGSGAPTLWEVATTKVEEFTVIAQAVIREFDKPRRTP